MFKFLSKKKPNPETKETPITSRNPSEIQPGIGAFLHGKLFIQVKSARNVEGKSGRFFGRVERVVTSSYDGVDPYCSVKLGYNKILQTDIKTNTESPEWNCQSELDICHDFSTIEFRIKAAKRSGPLSIISKVKHLSMHTVTAHEVLTKGTVEGWFPLAPYQKEITAEGGDTDSSDEEPTDLQAKPIPASPNDNLGEICIKLIYTPIAQITTLSNPHLADSYFPLRKGINVNFYQDADCPAGSLAPIKFHPTFEHRRCWAEMARSIMASTQLIYIAGWAVWHQLVMVRTEGDLWQGLTLGEMLIQKADEGVTVCVMVWDEYASGRFLKGIMGTHDEEVVAYFKKTKVNCVKVGRINAKYGGTADLHDTLMYTHHQKTVVVTRMDSETAKHRVEAWVGGLDLTNGRYDNNSHSLFRTIKEHDAHSDFWQACALGVTPESGPREPWHDIHSRITGAAAWDVMTNFEGRWRAQAPSSCKKTLPSHTAETFVTLEEEDKIRDGSFDVQILRSINQASTVVDEERPGLVPRESALTDMSIHKAYIHHIRSAKHFIYIENQYFLGSSHMWDSGQRAGFASHLVAIEIAEKICSKIRANERFVVYVNIPLFPEGPPDSGAVQEILSHQRKTVNLIVSKITACIRETESETCVSDWFNMFCLVNREGPEGGEGNGGTTPMELQLSKQRRFMIYIHSKFAIFDDSVAIIGSANINSRSLDGSRDTEIAIMTYQPEHLATGSNGYQPCDDAGELPKSDIAAFRASVWTEHLGGYFDEFEQPSSITCVNVIRELAQSNWMHFISDEPEAIADMPHGHLALYPYEYDPETGDATATTTTFPDFPPAALIKGKASPGIPNLLTG